MSVDKSWSVASNSWNETTFPAAPEMLDWFQTWIVKILFYTTITLIPVSTLHITYLDFQTFTSTLPSTALSSITPPSAIPTSSIQHAFYIISSCLLISLDWIQPDPRTWYSDALDPHSKLFTPDVGTLWYPLSLTLPLYLLHIAPLHPPSSSPLLSCHRSPFQ